ncbi:MAG: hypothetical protein Q7K45_06250, partial [Nanoarchaeota archaeon]|nr:hypothetical protein [Nanoarchaeota archaeon]
MDKFIDEERRVLRYDPSLREEDLRAIVPSIEEAQSLIDEDGQRYGGKYHIKIPSWREVILAVDSSNANARNLNFLLTTSYAVQARKMAYAEDTAAAQKEFPFTPCTVIGAPFTLDDKIICGVRGGQASSGKVDIAGGYLNANQRQGNPIFSNFRGELEEELGILAEEVKTCSLIGHFSDGEFNTLCFIMRANVDLESDEIIRRHKEAYEVYVEAKKEGIGEIRKAISEKGLNAIDAWEHHALFTIPGDPAYWREIVKTGEVVHNGH